MIQSIHIENFKSVVDLSLDLGTFNVLVGENGCGKSNILEAIAFGAGASANKLDFEFLGSRGIRVSNPEFMFSAFPNTKKRKKIDIQFFIGEEAYAFKIENDKKNPKKWIDRRLEKLSSSDLLLRYQETQKEFEAKKKVMDGKLIGEIDSRLKKLDIEINELYKKVDHISKHPEISEYIIYSPEENSLRKFEETTQIYPLGIRGEGLFQYLKGLAFDEKNSGTFNNIKKNLELLDWYETFEIPTNLMKNEYSLQIKDKYLNPALNYFDQRSANEGFLFLLFYSTLFTSKATPAFFAIDNIDIAFNPKLCMELTRNLSSLAKKYKKQVIVTTHNPAILDGLNLKDDNQRLFVVRRNDEGHTQAKRVEYKANRKLKLSEVWTSGFIGGLPENF